MKKGILNCVMYMLMFRGGNRVGPRRALIFAKEFGLDIDIPVKYEIDISDPYLLDFLFTYIRLGGNTALNCYVDCRTRLESDYDIDIWSVSQLFDLEIGEAVRYGDFQTLNRIFARNQEEMDFVNNLCNQNSKKRVLEKKAETNE